MVEEHIQPERDKPGPIALRWWEELKGDKGARSELRRAGVLSEIAFHPSYHRLYVSLADTKWRSWERLAIVAGAIAHVDENDSSEPFAAQMAQRRQGSEGALVSGLRFRRLLQFRDRHELFPKIVRVLRLMDRRANVINLANDMYWWPSDRIRREWAFRYYEKAPNES